MVDRRYRFHHHHYENPGSGYLRRLSRTLPAGTETYRGAVSNDAAVAHWRLGETAGTVAADATGRGQAATYAAGVAVGAGGALAGDADRAIALDGVDDHVVLPGGFANFSNGLTIEAWVHPTATSSWGRVVDLGNGAMADNIVFTRVGSSNDVRFEVFRGSTSVGIVNAPGVLALNTWQHLAVTLAPNGSVAIYNNGAVAATGTSQLPGVVHRSANYVARSNWGGDAYYSGYVDEVAIYDKALDAGRVAAHHRAGASGAVGSTYAYYGPTEGAPAGSCTAGTNQGGLLARTTAPD